MTAVLVPGEMTPGLLAGALLQAQLSPMGSGPNVISPSKCPEKLGGLFLFFKCKSSCFFFFLLCHLAYGILVSQTGLNLGLLQWKCRVLTSGPPEKSKSSWFLNVGSNSVILGIPDYLTCLLRNLYVGQEATVRTLYGTMNWLKMEKGVQHGCLLSPCLFNLHSEHIRRNAGLDELQARIKIGEGNNKLTYADDTTLTAESKEELKSLLTRVKEESERAGLRLNIKKLRSWHLPPLLHGKQKGKRWK